MRAMVLHQKFEAKATSVTQGLLRTAGGLYFSSVMAFGSQMARDGTCKRLSSEP